MRGKGADLDLNRCASRITPAYAGKRTEPHGSELAAEDHPRVCGEKRTVVRASFSLTGSPPRMRGKDGQKAEVHSRPRITPAYAGKRIFSHIQYFINKDHPRVCGEKSFFQRCRSLIEGSPPRMRGKGGFSLIDGGVSGITPAYAGKSRVHRGHGFTAKGSPPRMRGKEKALDLYGVVIGITPAYAGKSGRNKTRCKRL